MLYLCHLINGRGQDILGNSKWVIKSHKAHMVGDLLLAWPVQLLGTRLLSSQR